MPSRWAKAWFATNNLMPAKMKPQPEISVVIPTRNRAHMLGDTVASARDAGSDAEIIVVDDASSDDTAAICAAMPGVIYLRQSERRGTAAARNRGIAAASADLVAFLDDDDLRMPGSFAPQIAALKKAPEAAFTYARAFVGDSRQGLPTGDIIPQFIRSGDIFWALLEGNFVPCCTVVARRAALEKCGGFAETISAMEDYDLWVRMAEDLPVIATKDIVSIYRSRGLGTDQKTADRVAHGQTRQALLDRMLSAKRAMADAPRRRRARAKHARGVYLSLVGDALAAHADGGTGIAQAYLAQARKTVKLPFRAWLFTLIFSNQLQVLGARR